MTRLLGKKRTFRNYKSILILLGFMLLTVVIFRPIKLLRVTQVRAADYQIKYETTAKKAQELEIIATVATASAKPVYLREDQIRKLLSILIPKTEDIEHFMKILACENGTHDPNRININKPGLGYDLGIAQINSKFHANRVKEFFGQDFNEAMKDPVRNILYAVYLYQHQGFTPWVCNRLISKGGE